MSSIIENLHKILTSRYGRDVRQAIHDAIEDCYEDGRAISINVDPKVTTGTNIADIEINDTTYSLYAEGTVVSIDPKVTEGINIADITVDGQTTSLYGGSATIGGLTDVDITNPTEGEELSYDDTDNKWVNRITRIECTMAQYEAWEQGGTLLSDVDYYVTDAPSSEGVAIDDTTPSASTVYSSNKVNNLLSGKADTSDITNIINRLGGANKISLSFGVIENNASVTSPPYTNICIALVGRNRSGIFIGSNSDVQTTVAGSGLSASKGTSGNLNTITISNNGGTTSVVLFIYTESY